MAVEVVRVLPESPPPNLTNIFCQSAESSPSEMVRHELFYFVLFCYYYYQRSSSSLHPSGHLVGLRCDARAAGENLSSEIRQSGDRPLQGHSFSIKSSFGHLDELQQPEGRYARWGFPWCNFFYFRQDSVFKKPLISLQVKIALNSIGAIKSMDQDETQLQEVIMWVTTNRLLFSN